ncbi:MAG: SpoIID/LytB domain-containing protein [Thermodesulfovibrio sp.]|nr:SpoIID/LytB domain-containing protein [Thermodesulfovibrio sp.]
MIILRIVLIFFIIVNIVCETYSIDKNPNSYIRVLIGDRPPSTNEMDNLKKVSARAIVSGTIYRGEIELWKSAEGYFLINVVDLEEYVKGVVASEVGIHWPLEALKAQAVLARTYAVAHIIRNRTRNFYDVTSSVFHQVYKGEGGTEDIDKAVRETKGEILVYNKEPIMAFYHACSVEKTEDPKEIFGREYPYLKSVEVPFTPSPYNFWEKKISFELLEKALSINKIKDVEIVSYTTTGRIKELKFTDGEKEKIIKANELRRLLKWTPLPSTMVINMRVEEGGVIFEGRGYGHGVGMCQWCAFQMAQDGKNYKEILQYFYPGTDFSKINENN